VTVRVHFIKARCELENGPAQVQPTRLDEAIAREVAAQTNPPAERVTKALTWGADEHVLLALAAVGWVLTRTSPDPARRFGTHILACTLTTAVLPHLMKLFIDQKRPDRLTIKGHLRGIPCPAKPMTPFLPAMLCMSARLHRPRRCCRPVTETRYGLSGRCS
jgi:hypothetical protein